MPDGTETGFPQSLRALERKRSAPRTSSHIAEEAKLARFEEGRKHDTRGEAADMRPERDARIARSGKCRTQQLQHEPEADHPDRADDQRIEDDAQGHDDGDARA